MRRLRQSAAITRAGTQWATAPSEDPGGTNKQVTVTEGPEDANEGTGGWVGYVGTRMGPATVKIDLAIAGPV